MSEEKKEETLAPLMAVGVQVDAEESESTGIVTAEKNDTRRSKDTDSKRSSVHPSSSPKPGSSRKSTVSTGRGDTKEGKSDARRSRQSVKDTSIKEANRKPRASLSPKRTHRPNAEDRDAKRKARASRAAATTPGVQWANDSFQASSDESLGTGSPSRSSRDEKRGRRPRSANSIKDDEKRAARRSRKSGPVLPGAHSYASSSEDDLEDEDPRSSRRKHRSKNDEKATARRARKSTPVLPGAHAYDPEDQFDPVEVVNDKYNGKGSKKGRSKKDEKETARRARKSAPAVPGAHSYDPNADDGTSGGRTREENKKMRSAANSRRNKEAEIEVHGAATNTDLAAKYDAMNGGTMASNGEFVAQAMVVEEGDEETGNKRDAMLAENDCIAEEREQERRVLKQEEAERKAKEQANKRRKRLICAAVLVAILGGVGAYLGLTLGGSDPEPVIQVESEVEESNGPTNSPSTSPSFAPSGAPTEKPTLNLIYDPPTPEDCKVIEAVEKFEGEDELLKRNFDVMLEVQVPDGSNIETAVSAIKQRVQTVLMPDLAGCFEEEVIGLNRNLSAMILRGTQRRLNSESMRFVIKNGDVMVSDEGGDCTTTTADNCHSISINLDLSMKGDERLLFIIGIISQVFNLENLPPNEQVIVVAVLSVASNDPTNEPSKAPSGMPSVAPSNMPTLSPTTSPPSNQPSLSPTSSLSTLPSVEPSLAPTQSPTCVATADYFLDGVFTNEVTAPESVHTFDCGAATDFAIVTSDPVTCEITCLASLPASALVATCQVENRFSFLTDPTMISGDVLMGHVSASSVLACTSTLPLVTAAPTQTPTVTPSTAPSMVPSLEPSSAPSFVPSLLPSMMPSLEPSVSPSESPSTVPSEAPSAVPSSNPTTPKPSAAPSSQPSRSPTPKPSQNPSAAPTYPIEEEVAVTGNSFVVESVDTNGKYFTVSANNFPLEINLFENPENKIVIRGDNLSAVSRNKNRGLTGIVMYYDEGSNTFRGNYNPSEYATDNDWVAGDSVTLDDLTAFTNGACSREPYRIVDMENIELPSQTVRLNIPISSIRIGKQGVVGNSWKNMIYTVYLDDPVSTLWTDAVNPVIDISISTDDGASYTTIPASGSDPTLRPLGSSVSGYLKVKIIGATVSTLNSLVTAREAGGMHMAFC